MAEERRVRPDAAEVESVRVHGVAELPQVVVEGLSVWLQGPFGQGLESRFVRDGVGERTGYVRVLHHESCFVWCWECRF